MSKPDPDLDHLAAAVQLVNQKFAENTGHDLAAKVLTPAQQREVQAAGDRARARGKR